MTTPGACPACGEYFANLDAHTALSHPAAPAARPAFTVELNEAEAVEVFRGLAKQQWSWDQAGIRVQERRDANASAYRKLQETGALAPPAPWRVIHHAADRELCRERGEHHPAARHLSNTCTSFEEGTS